MVKPKLKRGLPSVHPIYLLLLLLLLVAANHGVHGVVGPAAANDQIDEHLSTVSSSGRHVGPGRPKPVQSARRLAATPSALPTYATRSTWTAAAAANQEAEKAKTNTIRTDGAVPYRWARNSRPCGGERQTRGRLPRFNCFATEQGRNTTTQREASAAPAPKQPRRPRPRAPPPRQKAAALHFPQVGTRPAGRRRPLLRAPGRPAGRLYTRAILTPPRVPAAHADKMKFGATYEEYLRAEQDKFLRECSHVEYKRLKKVLKKCRVGRSLQADGTNGDEQQDGDDESSEDCECNSCTLCDEMFFTELNKEASEIAGCFRSRVQRLLHLHVPSGLQRYIWRFRQCFIDDQQIMVQEGRMLLNYVTMNAIAIRKILKKYDKIHGSVSGRDFKSKMQTEHIELLQSPWLIELGAFHLNCDDPDADEIGSGGFFKNGFFKNFSCDLTGAQPLLTMAISDTLKYEYSLTCPICLDTLFYPYALSCGHLFCKSCACGAASVYIFQGVRSAPPEAKCPVCRAVGVFARAVHMTELGSLLKRRDKDYWKQRLREERTTMVKQSKEYWDSQAMLSMGI